MKNSVDRAAVQRLAWPLLISQSLSSAAFITRATTPLLWVQQHTLRASPALPMRRRLR